MKPQIRIFNNPLLERLTKTSLYGVVGIFICVICYTLYLSIALNPYYAIPLFLCGILCWSLNEYLIHRFVFHNAIFQRTFPRFYLIIHGIHHETPLDKNRLLVPLYVTLPLGSLVYLFFYWCQGDYANPIFCGFILGYLNYDITHYRIHHHQPQTSLGKHLRAYHYRHHFKDHTNNFGVSSPLWDVFFHSKIATDQ